MLLRSQNVLRLISHWGSHLLHRLKRAKLELTDFAEVKERTQCLSSSEFASFPEITKVIIRPALFPSFSGQTRGWPYHQDFRRRCMLTFLETPNSPAVSRTGCFLIMLKIHFLKRPSICVLRHTVCTWSLMYVWHCLWRGRYNNHFTNF